MISRVPTLVVGNATVKTLTSIEYTSRHNFICKVHQQDLTLKYNLVANYHHLYKYTPHFGK